MQREESVTIEGEKLPLLGLDAPLSVDMVIMRCTGSNISERIAITELLLTKDGRFVLISSPFQNLAAKRKE